MKIKYLAKILGGQDGAIYNGYLFRFNNSGTCYVYDIKSNRLNQEMKCIDIFKLSKDELVLPHSNTVMFGYEFFYEDDEFPLLYVNVYNTYAQCENKREGVTCVYRIYRLNGNFFAELVQIIEIGFVKDVLWCSQNISDVRPYGNFVIDCKNSTYYAFTMRDEDDLTRYFSFKLPKVSDGYFDEILGIKRIILSKEDIIDMFDCSYHHFIQGATFYDGKVYSLEGFCNSKDNPPAIRIIDVMKRCEIDYILLSNFELDNEPEMIDFYDGKFYYSDNIGRLYILDFELIS